MPRWTPDGLKPIRKVSLAGVASYSFNAAQGLDFVNFQGYKIRLVGVRPGTDGASVWLRTSGNSGASDYDSAGQAWVHNSTFTANSQALAAQIALTPGNVGNVGANELGVTGTIELINSGSAISEPTFQIDLSYRDASGVRFFHKATAVRRTTTAITSIDILTSDAVNFGTGELYIYGERKIA